MGKLVITEEVLSNAHFLHTPYPAMFCIGAYNLIFHSVLNSQVKKIHLYFLSNY